ncbi:MAG: class I SAM-dependent methyltransferase [Methylococcales bacterium]
MNQKAIEQKWDGIYKNTDNSQVVDVLLQNDYLLPRKGQALDLACGLGGNALFLADKGLKAHAWDISSLALKKLQKNAEKKALKIAIKQVYIEPDCLPKNTFDVIVLAHFLDRSLCNAIMDALKSGGLLFYQTYVREKIDLRGPNNPAFLLARNELLQLFNPMTVLVYRENSLVGDLECGERNEALFVGQKC